MFEVVAAFFVVLSVGVFVAHALDAYRRYEASLPFAFSQLYKPADGSVLYWSVQM
jgi:hypothetical protein